MTDQRATLTSTFPHPETFPPDPGETRLREWYAHARHTTRVGFIRSIDGKATGPDGSSRSLNGPEDLRILRILRSLADVVVVGARTARMEGYGDIALPLALREAREHAGDSPVPHLALVTESGDIPSGLSIDTTWVVTTDSARARATLGPTWHSRIFVAGERHLDPRAIVSQLTSVGLSRVLCEGGPSIADAFFASDVVDDYCLTTSTVRGGDNSPLAPAVPRAMTCAHRLEGGSFVMERWAYAHKRESQYPL